MIDSYMMEYLVIDMGVKSRELRQSGWPLSSAMNDSSTGCYGWGGHVDMQVVHTVTVCTSIQAYEGPNIGLPRKPPMLMLGPCPQVQESEAHIVNGRGGGLEQSKIVFQGIRPFPAEASLSSRM